MRSPADQARLSLHTSLDGREKDVEASAPRKDSEDTAPRRGWWDYVPENEQRAPSVPEQQSTTSPELSSRLLRWWNSEKTPPDIAFQRKSSLPGDRPLTQPSRVSVVSAGAGAPLRLSKTSGGSGTRPYDSAIPPSTSAMRRFITRMPGIEAFRIMLKNEVCHCRYIMYLSAPYASRPVII